MEALSDQLAENGTQTLDMAAAIPPEWAAEGAITCVAGQSALDEIGAIVLIQLLQHQGFNPRLIRMADVSAAHLHGIETTGIKLVCISMLDVEHRGAYVKFLIRRLRRIYPQVTLLGGYWKYESTERGPTANEAAAVVDEKVSTLAGAIGFCLKAAARDMPPGEIAPAPATGS